MKQLTTYINEKANFIVKKHVKRTLDSLSDELALAEQDTLLLKINDEYSLTDSYIGEDKYDGNKDDVVGICLGNGTWALTQWVGLTKKMKWASKDSALYKTKVNNTNDDGLKATNKVLDVKDADKEELWCELLKVRKEYKDAYIPSKDELESIYKNKTKLEENLLALMPGDYWSASHYGDSYSDAFRVYFSNGTVYYSFKSDECLSQILLHFGDVLTAKNK